MPRYRNLSGRSGIVAYETTGDTITLTFVNGDRYRYTAANPGLAMVRRMQALAEAGRGLSTLVSQHVRDDYEEKLD